MSVPDSTQNRPFVTIGITCYDAEATIERAVASATRQSWKDFEIIIVDDGSSDRSAAVLDKLENSDPAITVIRHEQNRGYAGALNTIVKNARGELVAFFDDDDVSEPDRLEKQWQRLSSYENRAQNSRVLCYTNRNVATPDGEFLKNHVLAIGRKPVEPSGPAVADFLLWHRRKPGFAWGQFGSCTLLARKKTIEEAGGFDESFRRGAEWDLAIRLALAGGHFVAVDEPLVTQYITRTPDKAGTLPLNQILGLREKHEGYLKSKRVYRASIAMAHARFHYARKNKAKSRFYLALACVLSPFKVLPSEMANWKQK
jgi:glycosyltransferase involved in cell wall biosynthesis